MLHKLKSIDKIYQANQMSTYQVTQNLPSYIFAQKK